MPCNGKIKTIFLLALTLILPFTQNCFAEIITEDGSPQEHGYRKHIPKISRNLATGVTELVREVVDNDDEDSLENVAEDVLDNDLSLAVPEVRDDVVADQSDEETNTTETTNNSVDDPELVIQILKAFSLLHDSGYLVQ